jgi:hypothetical protein
VRRKRHPPLVWMTIGATGEVQTVGKGVERGRIRGQGPVDIRCIRHGAGVILEQGKRRVPVIGGCFDSMVSGCIQRQQQIPTHLTGFITGEQRRMVWQTPCEIVSLPGKAAHKTPTVPGVVALVQLQQNRCIVQRCRAHLIRTAGPSRKTRPTDCMASGVKNINIPESTIEASNAIKQNQPKMSLMCAHRDIVHQRCGNPVTAPVGMNNQTGETTGRNHDRSKTHHPFVQNIAADQRRSNQRTTHLSGYITRRSLDTLPPA